MRSQISTGRVGSDEDLCKLWRVGSKIVEIYFCLLENVCANSDANLSNHLLQCPFHSVFMVHHVYFSCIFLHVMLERLYEYKCNMEDVKTVFRKCVFRVGSVVNSGSGEVGSMGACKISSRVGKLGMET